MPSPEVVLADVVRGDARYAYEAYEFLFQALHHTQKMRGDAADEAGSEMDAPHHVRGRELAEGFCDLAVREFGLMARTVLRSWGIHETKDIGEMVYNLIGVGLMDKTEEDSKEDFHNLFEIDAVLTQNCQFTIDGMIP